MAEGIKDDVEIGEGTKVYGRVNLYGCKIGKNCVIGSFVEIRKDVVIGDNCKIQAFAFIPEGVTIEDNVFIGPHVCFTNDKYPRACNEDGSLKGPNDWKVVETLVRKGASIGANATILCGSTIGKNSMVAAGAVVTGEVPPNAIVKGNPAKISKSGRE
jgi:acetyltransferase-like isoleucine patch superfamily enzyme